jgi:hypothetical protein
MPIIYFVGTLLGLVILGFILGYKGYKNWPLGYILALVWPVGIFIALFLPQKKK